jgi:hypothetical protein
VLEKKDTSIQEVISTDCKVPVSYFRISVPNSVNKNGRIFTHCNKHLSSYYSLNRFLVLVLKYTVLKAVPIPYGILPKISKSVADPDANLFHPDPDHAFHFDTDTDPAFQFDTDPDPTV